VNKENSMAEKTPSKNMDNIKPNDRFKDKDTRAGERIVKVVQLEVGGKALCENVATGKRTRIDLGALGKRWTRLPAEDQTPQPQPEESKEG
jgi:hypothetical protein